METPELAKTILFSNDVDDETFNWFYKKISQESYRVFLDILFLNLVNFKKIKSRFFVISGDNDGWFSVSEPTQMAKDLKATLKIYKDTHHEIMLSPLRLEVAKDITNWINMSITKEFSKQITNGENISHGKPATPY